MGKLELDESFLKFDWYNCSITKAVYVHLILNSYNQEGQYRGFKVERGEYISSTNQIGKECNIHESKVFYAIIRLSESKHIEFDGLGKNYQEFNYNVQDDRLHHELTRYKIIMDNDQ